MMNSYSRQRFRPKVERLANSVDWGTLTTGYGNPDPNIGKTIVDLACNLHDPHVHSGDELYCSVANQGDPGEATPYVAEIVVTILRNDWCVDYDALYSVLDVMMEVYTSLTGIDPESGEREYLWVLTRRVIGRAMDVYLRHIHELPTNQIVHLLDLLGWWAPKFPEILEHLEMEVLAASGERADLVAKTLMSFILSNSKEHYCPDERLELEL